MPSHPIVQSADFAEAQTRFSADIGCWIADCIARYTEMPPTNIHDQATYTTAWVPYIAAMNDSAARAFLIRLRDQLRDHYVASKQWHHGYWCQHEVHHGTEHFELFLGSLARLLPDDPATTEQLHDAAEHCGNWIPTVPAWFDWNTGLFRSTYLGTVEVGSATDSAINIPDHLRCVNLCLLAHRGRYDARFLELATRHAGLWADAIGTGTALPLALTATGPLYDLTPAEEAHYRSFVGQALADTTLAVERAENFLASDAINTFLSLWRTTGEARFRRAAERLLDTLVPHLSDPDAGTVAAAIRDFRQATGDTHYDAAVLAAVARHDPWGWQTLTLDLAAPDAEQRPVGIGKRADMLHWLEDGHHRQHNPLLLALAAELTDDHALAARSLDIARTAFALAREALPDGRDHGCSSRSVSAVARGNGRENHAGMITAVFAPLAAYFNTPIAIEL